MSLNCFSNLSWPWILRIYRLYSGYESSLQLVTAGRRKCTMQLFYSSQSSPSSSLIEELTGFQVFHLLLEWVFERDFFIKIFASRQLADLQRRRVQTSLNIQSNIFGSWLFTKEELQRWCSSRSPYYKNKKYSWHRIPEHSWKSNSKILVLKWLIYR